MKKITKLLFTILLCLSFTNIITSCSSDNDSVEEVSNIGIGNGVTAVSSEKEIKVSVYGETINISFVTSGSWTCLLNNETTCNWAEVMSSTGSSKGGNSSLTLDIAKNTTNAERTLSVAIKVAGHDKAQVICEIKQDATGMSSSLDKTLNTKMNEYLKEHYLFNEEYNTLDIDCDNISYKDFLTTYLSKMTTNMEDGGIYREYSSNAGQRYIYSYIDKIGTFSEGTKSVSRSSQTVGTGLGTFFASYMEDRVTIGLTIGYVYEGSPADKAGLKRGDNIISVNGEKINRNNYKSYMEELFYANEPKTYKIGYSRFVANDELKRYDTVYGSTNLTPDSYYANPIIYASEMKDKAENPTYNVGYLVYLGFDDNYEAELKQIIQKFKADKITNLILDLRFNLGGATELSRYLSSSIAGESYKEKVFDCIERNTGKTENIYFDNGDYLDLKGVSIICSESTASSSELVISSLRGVDFPVKLYGSKTEGKNVGMEVQTFQVGNSLYEFAPITFRSYNAKGWCDYADGINADVMLNNQNNNYEDDIDNAFPYAFGDWQNYDFNLPLWYALCDIRGVSPTGEATKSRSDGKSVRLGTPKTKIISLPSIPFKRSFGTYGSLIYNTNNK